MRSQNLERVDRPAESRALKPYDARPSRSPPQASISGRRDSFRPPRYGGQHAWSIALWHELDRALHLLGAAHPDPVGVGRRLARPADSLRRHDAEVGEQSKDPVGELHAHRAELDDDARSPVLKRPRASALEESCEQGPLVLVRAVPNKVGEALLVRRASQPEDPRPPARDDA